MEFTNYIVTKDEAIASIAKKHGVTPAQIRNHNIDMMRFFAKDTREEIVKGQQRILIPIFKDQEDKREERKVVDPFKNYPFDINARYRCEQINTSSMNGNIFSYAEQKHQFLLQHSVGRELKGHVQLEEIIFDFTPSSLNDSFGVLTATELIRNNIYFSISPENGRVATILNKPQIYEKWKRYRDKDFREEPFFQKIERASSEKAEELINMGNKQFSPSYEMAEEEHRRHLFNFICFDRPLVSEIENTGEEDFPYLSTIVPPVVVPVKFRYEVISDEEGILKYRKIGRLLLTPNHIAEMKKVYDQIHKPSVKYNFTEYQLKFEAVVTFNRQEQLVETANVSIIESIADNIESTCQYKVKRLHNFTPT